jgi:hypothetical protein
MKSIQTTKRVYAKPTTEIITTNLAEVMMQTVSIEKRDEEYATGGGDAKAYFFDDETKNDQHWKWGKVWED